MSHLLDTYDPDWEARWEAANARCDALRPAMLARHANGQRAACAAEWRKASDALHSAFHAQFRTVDDFRGFRVDWFAAGHDGEEPATAIPDGLTLQELHAHLDRLSATARAAVRERERLPPRDPPGLAAFRTPASVDAERHVAHLELDIPDHSRSVRCLLAVEATPHAAHLCFVWVRDGGSVCNDIEALATYLCRERLYRRRGWRGLFGLRGMGGHWTADIAIYEYDPFRASDSSQDSFERVAMRWDHSKGFADPSWHAYPSVPVWLADVADYPPSTVTLPASSGVRLPPSPRWRPAMPKLHWPTSST